MILQAYSIFDSCARIYHPPMFLANDAVASRNIATLKNDQATTLGQNPEDYHIYHIGEYDDLTGVLKSFEHVKINEIKPLQEVSPI